MSQAFTLRLATCPAPIRLLAFLLLLAMLWLPLAAPISWLVSDRNLASILTMVLLYAEFIWLTRFWNRQVYQQTHGLQRYGLEFNGLMAKEWLVGLTIGFVSLLTLFVVEGWLSWLTWKTPTMPLGRLAVEGGAIALGVGFAEELFFRGWLLDELERDYQPQVALWVNSLLFAILHFIKPLPDVWRTLPQFAGLLLLGLILVWAKRQTLRIPAYYNPLVPQLATKPGTALHGRLGLPMGLHGGLVWGYYIINVGGLVDYSGLVPAWVTGVDRNPLAGLMGLLFLSLIAAVIKLPWVRSRSASGPR